MRQKFIIDHQLLVGVTVSQREFMHVDDLSEAVIYCLERWNPSKNNAPKDKSGNPLYFLNVGTGEDISISSLSEII